MDALVHCPPPLAGYIKAEKIRRLDCNPFVNTKIKRKSLPGTTYSALHHRALTQTNVLVPWPDGRRRRSSLWPGPMAHYCNGSPRPSPPWDHCCWVVQPKGFNILTGVGHGLFPLVLKILLIGKLITITLQIATWQELQTISIDGPPSVQICLKTLVQLLHPINNGPQSNLKKSE